MTGAPGMPGIFPPNQTGGNLPPRPISVPGGGVPPRSPSPPSSGSSAPKAAPDKSLGRTLFFIKILKFATIAATTVVIRFNVPPYIEALRGMFPQSAVEVFFGRVPLVGWVFTAGGDIGIFLGGIAVWGLFQGIEVLPAVLLGNRAAVKILAKQSSSSALPVASSDPEPVRWLKGVYNKLPFSWLRRMKTFQAIAYLGDLLFVISFYPPVSSAGFSFTGIALVAVLLLSFQVAIGLYTMLSSVEGSIREGARSNA